MAYFHGCSADYFEPELGELTVSVLESLGFTVLLPHQGCCGLSMQSNGMFKAARRAAQDNIKKLEPIIQAGIPLIGTSTSCTMAIKHDYRSLLGLAGRQVEALAEATRDIFEFLAWDEPDSLGQAALNTVDRSVLYQAPCRLRSQGMGTPALNILRRIPGLEVLVSDAACCGVAGTYGMKSERYQVARAVGESLFQQAREMQVDMVVTNSETCRWWIEAHSGVQNVHPIQILAWSMGLTSDPANPRDSNGKV